MSTQHMIPLWSAGALTVLWLCLLFKVSRNKVAAKGYKGFWLAMLSWPMLLSSELWQLVGGASPWVAAVAVVAMPLLLAGIYRNLLAMLWRKPNLVLWPFYAAGIGLLVLVAIQGWLNGSDWQQWPGFAPLGEPLSYWAVYLSCLIAAFLFLYISIVLIEQLQQYHHELPLQVVDTEMYHIKGLSGASGFAVGMAFCLAIIVAAVAFGFLPLTFWLAWFHLGLALTTLVLLAQLSRAHRPSPSPFDHDAMSEAPKMSQSTAQALLKRAEAAVISQKAYKEIGLTLAVFAERAGISASDICLALLAGKKTHFRGFIYQYRMKYAKQVLLGSDTKLGSVTKRLKLGANGTASRSFLKYLESRH